jgi:hypothetical protein
MRRYDKNGPLAMGFNLIFLVFILAPLVVVCLVAFTDKGSRLPTRATCPCRGTDSRCAGLSRYSTTRNSSMLSGTAFTWQSAPRRWR